MYQDDVFVASNGVTVNYRVKLPKYDFNHTLFVFSGYRERKADIYDFQNALGDFPGRVIWIDDYFEGQFCYYMCIGMDFRISDAVIEFIRSISQSFGIIDKKQVTFTGYSKGGG